MSGRTEISYLTLPEALQDVFLRQRTGVLAIASSGRREKLIALAGQAYLSGSNPGRERLAAILAAPPGAEDNPRFDARAYLAESLAAWVRELAEELVSWQISDLRFSSELPETPDDLVGPAPTALLVMELYSRGWSMEDLLNRLGGKGARYRAVEDDRYRLRVPELDSEEVLLLHRLERPATVSSLIAEGEGAPSVLCRLVRLSAVGLIGVEHVSGSWTSPVSREVQQEISERVREDLELRPLELDRSEQEAELGKLLHDYGRLGFYDLLAVTADSSTEEIHASFMRRARIAHPSQADALGLTKAGLKLEWLFSRLTEAYLVLSDPDRAADYRRAAGVVASAQSVEPDSTARRSERVSLARDAYREALDHVEEEDFFYAIEMLRRAVLLDERPEYYALLGRCYMQNRKWLNMAVDSFRRALILRRDDEELRNELDEAKRRLEAYQEAQGRKKRPRATDEERDQARARRLLAKLRGESD